jgi:predicted DNA-binding helix-hairpin-helix protein
LRRVYYSAFSPIQHSDARLPARPAPLIREHRLYQADWLMRFYQFQPDELTPAASSNLDLRIDPKLAWALRNRQHFPVDVNKAERYRLLRVPGLGVRNVNRILQMRRNYPIRLDDLAKLRIPMAKVRPWVITADFNPDALRLDRDDLHQRVIPRQVQLELFSAAQSAMTGEV